MAFLANLPFRTKLFMLLFIPLLGMMTLGIFGSVEKHGIMQRMERISHLARLAVAISDLVHEVQKERGASAGFIGSGGEKFRDALSKQRQLTDQKKALLVNQATGISEIKETGSEQKELFWTAMDRLDELDGVRNRVDGLDISTQGVLNYYSGTNSALLHSIEYLSSLASTVEMTALTATYVNFLKGKERAGIERAVITDTFARNGFGPGMYRQFSALVSEQETFFEVARLMTTPDQLAYVKNKMTNPAVDEVERMREVAFNSGYASPLYIHLGKLYQNMALRGAYHSVKNLLIRGSWYGYKDYAAWPEKQEHYRQQFANNYQAIEKIVQQIFALPPELLTAAQRNDVAIVWQNVKDYQASIDVIIELQNQGRHLHEIDYDKARGG